MLAKIITVFNQKGGCAKTMTTMQLAGTFGAHGVRTFVIDMDPQNTAALWATAASMDAPFPATVISLSPRKESFVEKLIGPGGAAHNHDVVLVDCPPALESRVPWASLLVSDFAIVPVAPVLDNVWASRQAEQLIQEAAKENAALNAAYLLSMVRRGKVFDECLQQLVARAQLPILDTRISLRNAYPESQIYGCAVGAFGKSAAQDEMDRLARELAAKLGFALKESV